MINKDFIITLAWPEGMVTQIPGTIDFFPRMENTELVTQH